MARTLDDIVEALRRSKGRDMGCTLLLGAGCSKTAGIPLAGGIVDDIRKNALYERVYQRALDRARRERNPHAVEPSYGECMTEMEKGDQRALIRSYIDAARLNWAHAGIAALIKHGYVGRVLTTNFDPLVARACSVFNELPGVYDLTMSDIRNYKELPDKAIFHLHGQRYGFSMLNNPDELERHKRSVEPLFKHAREGRTWIVCGYSGENDPLFDLIKSCDEYDHALYWIGREPDPPAHVQALLSSAHAKGCHYLQFAGADEFFFRLCGALGIADFPFMHRPLEHIEEILAQFVDFPSAATDSGIDLLGVAKASIEYHKNAYFQASAQEAADQKIYELVASQGHAAAASAISQDTSLAAQTSPLARAWLKLLEGVDLYEEAGRSNDPSWALELYRKGSELNATAVQIKPDYHEALYNWGTALAAQTQRSPDADAHHLWAEAGEKFAAALAIKPDLHEALYNWGNALDEQAQRSPDADAHRLWAEAGEKFAAALAIKPDDHEALYNWGNALYAQAQRSPDADAHRLWAEAGEKFAAALAIKPDLHEALHNWGNALDEQAQRSPDADAHRLWAEAGEKYAAALAIKPDKHEALNNWGHALDAQAQRSPDADAHRLWAEAGEKYAAALAIKPDLNKALNNWGIALLAQAHHGSGEERESLLRQAEDKLIQSEAIAPGSAAYNLACVYAVRGALLQMVEWLDRSQAAGDLPTREHIAEDKDFDAVRDTPEFKAWLTKMGWVD
jgi:Tfp pilus assembly protein PilF